MKALAPGKLVLSGAYCVLEGAVAIVTAVDRYVSCDPRRAAELVTDEVRAALPHGPYPHFDAQALREGGQKLGLGSSAAILVGSLAALEPAGSEETVLRRAVERRALESHRLAQGGGSGIDVAASVWGGTLLARRRGVARADAGSSAAQQGDERSQRGLELRHVQLPRGLVLEAWSSGVPASTSRLLAAVARVKAREPQRHAALLSRLSCAAEGAAEALLGGDLQRLLRHLDAQRVGLQALGAAADAPIVTPEVAALATVANAEGAALLPSGAGGGDMVLWMSDHPSPPAFQQLAETLGHRKLRLGVHARGVHHRALDQLSSE